MNVRKVQELDIKMKRKIRKLKNYIKVDSLDIAFTIMAVLLMLSCQGCATYKQLMEGQPCDDLFNTFKEYINADYC